LSVFKYDKVGQIDAHKQFIKQVGADKAEKLSKQHDSEILRRNIYIALQENVFADGGK